jgi:hypothetical protein
MGTIAPMGVAPYRIAEPRPVVRTPVRKRAMAPEEAVSRSTKLWSPDAVETRRAIERNQQEQLGANKIDKQLLRRSLKQAMRGRFGVPSSGSHYATKVEDVVVWTDFDFGVRWGAQFGYSQTIATQQLDKLLGHGGILALLGWPQTRWDRLTNDNIPATADLVARLCGEFVDAVPEIWARSGLANVPLPR